MRLEPLHERRASSRVPTRRVSGRSTSSPSRPLRAASQRLASSSSSVVGVDPLARRVTFGQLAHERLDQRREAERVLHARLRVHRPDLDRAEVGMRADVVPHPGVVLDHDRPRSSSRSAARSRPSRRRPAGRRRAGSRGRSACARTRARSPRRARTASSPTARAAAARARARRWRRGSPSRRRRGRRGRACRRSARAAPRSRASRPARGSAPRRRRAGPPSCANGCVPAEPIRSPRRSAAAATLARSARRCAPAGARVGRGGRRDLQHGGEQLGLDAVVARALLEQHVDRVRERERLGIEDHQLLLDADRVAAAR